MTEQKILIVESNTPDLISNGYRPAADYFISTFGALDEPVICSVTRPYEAPLKVQELEGIDGVVFTGSSVDWSCDSKQARMGIPCPMLLKTVYRFGAVVTVYNWQGLCLVDRLVHRPTV